MLCGLIFRQPLRFFSRGRLRIKRRQGVEKPFSAPLHWGETGETVAKTAELIAQKDPKGLGPWSPRQERALEGYPESKGGEEESTNWLSGMAGGNGGITIPPRLWPVTLRRIFRYSRTLI
jgi:hypothetical protein